MVDRKTKDLARKKAEEAGAEERAQKSETDFLIEAIAERLDQIEARLNQGQPPLHPRDSAFTKRG